MAKCALYRHFDGAGALLYVGIACNPFRRSVNHSTNADWYESVSKIEIEWHPTREAALWFEEMAISRENPKFNRMRPAGVDEIAQPQKKGIRARRPEVQRQIDELIAEASGLGFKLHKNLCLSSVEYKLARIKAGKDPESVDPL